MVFFKKKYRNTIKVFIGSDHGGFELKEYIKNIKFDKIEGKDVKMIDCGTYSANSVHYPVFAKKVVKKLLKYVPKKVEDKQSNFGILICTTGIGMSMCANKYKRIRASLVHCVEEASMTREHNNSNILCLGQKFVNKSDVEEIVKTFLSTNFEGGRHTIRIKMY